MSARIAGYDFARSFAVFGLVVANFSHSVDHSDFYLLHDFIQAGTTITFLILGGVGISLLERQNKRTNDAHRSADSRKRLISRAAFLLVIGICCYSILRDNCLCFFSICLAIGAMLLRVSDRWLWVFAFIFALIWGAFTFLIFGYYEIIEEFSRYWDTFRDDNPWTAEGLIFRIFLYKFHLLFSWAGFLLIGMWLGRKEVHFRRVRKGVFFGGAAVALVSLAPWLLMFYAPLLLRYVLFLLAPSRPTLSDISESGVDPILMLLTLLHTLAPCGIAAAIIGGSLILTERFPDAKWIKPFLTTGQLALTLYVIHLIIGEGLLKTLGVLDKTLPYAIGSAVIFCICALIFSHFWRKRFERGPLEWGMRRITG